MRNLIYILLSVAFLFSSCAKDDDNIKQGRTIILRANSASDTPRATFEDSQTKWVDGDNLAVIFVDKEGSKSYGPYQFTHQGENNEGSFRCDGVSVGEAESYNVYALHEPNVTVAGSEAKINIGADIQTQIGASSAHVAQFDPLYGVAEVADLNNISLSMAHMASVISFTLRNDMEADMTLESATITTSESDVVLAKRVDFNLVTGEMKGAETTRKVKLNFSAVTLAKGETLTAWVAVSPFELQAGDKLNFMIEAENKMFTYTKTLGSAVTFGAGKIKNLSEAISLAESAKTVTFDFTTIDNSVVGLPASSEANILEGSYTIGGQTLAINSEVPFYYLSSAFDGTVSLAFYTNSSDSYKYAKIYIPKCEFGVYKIQSVRVTLNGSSSDNVKLAVMPESQDAKKYAENMFVKQGTSGGVVNLKMPDGIDPSTQYCICLKGKSVKTCKISKIEVNYTN